MTPPAATFDIAPPPSWVKTYPPETLASAESDDEGIAHVLFDEQHNLDPRSAYHHTAYRVTSDNGVQNGSSIDVGFDPSHERLTVHFIRIIRDGQTLDRLDRSKIHLLQREREMESFIYDGSFTASCQLEDVRVGDVIEYAYTLDGANPVLKGHYFGTFMTEWGVPVEHAVLRIVRPTDRQLHFQTENRQIEPTITTADGRTEWLWDERHIAAHHADTRTPPGYNGFGVLRVSEFANWQEVVDWAAPLYQCDTTPSPELEEEMARISATNGVDGAILAALRFVQEQIRYLGIETGVNSHQPTAPSEVLRRRFGDCKDKTLLLATILRKSGFQATPMLVSTWNRGEVAKYLPSPDAFNHVILELQLGSSRWWIDATRTAQRGPLSELYVTDFGYGLLVRPGITDLTPCGPPPTALPRKKIVETYTVGKPGEEARLDVVTEFHGLAAESARAVYQTVSKENLAKDLEKFYTRRFSGAHTAKPPEYEELPDANACRLREHYVIPAIWQLSEDKKEYEFALYPADLDREMGSPGVTGRHDPLGLQYPSETTQEINVEMFREWPLKRADHAVDNDFFHYQKTSRVRRQNRPDDLSLQDDPGSGACLRTGDVRPGVALGQRRPRLYLHLSYPGTTGGRRYDIQPRSAAAEASTGPSPWLSWPSSAR